MVGALLKLQLDTQTALLLLMGILFGSLINIPVKRMIRVQEVESHPLAVFGLTGFFPELKSAQKVTVVAVNVGGCVIPTGIALYEILFIFSKGIGAATLVGVAVLINTWVCYRLAKPVRGIGIAMPALIPPLVAALSALILIPGDGPPVAFVAGVLGPLIGADLMHLRDIPRISTGMASIGGAGTFDGIVLSGILAAYLV